MGKSELMSGKSQWQNKNWQQVNVAHTHTLSRSSHRDGVNSGKEGGQMYIRKARNFPNTPVGHIFLQANRHFKTIKDKHMAAPTLRVHAKQTPRVGRMASASVLQLSSKTNQILTRVAAVQQNQT